MYRRFLSTGSCERVGGWDVTHTQRRERVEFLGGGPFCDFAKWGKKANLFPFMWTTRAANRRTIF
jgi:hypothetical protein